VSALRREVRALKKSKGQQGKRAEIANQSDTRMKLIHPAEAVLFKAFFDEFFREKVWPYVSNKDTFMTRTAVDLSNSIVLNLGNTMPKGPALGWIGRLPEDNQEFFAELDLDSTVQELNDQYIEDAIKKLRSLAVSKNLDLDKSNINPGDDNALRDYFNKLRKHKGVEEGE
jgi:hypothetical protein